MYESILVPVDLEHREQVSKAVKIAVNLARLYGAQLTIASVTTAAPSAVAHNPKEFQAALDVFVSEIRAANNLEITGKMVLSHDPTIDVSDTIIETASELGCDLIVMASHVPGLVDYVLGSRAGHTAVHATVSVFVVR